MTGMKISQLDDAVTLIGDETLVVVQNGVTKKADLTAIPAAVITAALGAEAAASVATLAALKALTTRPEAVIVETGQAKGLWQWELGSSTTADDALVVQCTSGTAGRYFRIYTDTIEAGWFSTVQSAADAAHGKIFTVTPGSTVTVAVPSQQSTIQDALNAIRRWSIPRAAAVQINVADGTYTLTSTIAPDHPDGARVSIIGDTTTPANCTLRFSGNIAGLYVADGNVLGGFNGFRMEKLTTKENIGILADHGAVIQCGPKLEIDNFYYGVAARYGSTILCDGTSGSNRVYVTNAGDVGIWAFVGSAIHCDYALVEDAVDSGNSLGWGISAEYGSAIACQSAEVSGCYRGGIAAFSGSGVRAYSANVHDNTGVGSGSHGFDCQSGGMIVAHSATSEDNSGYGTYSDGYGMIFASPAITYSGNALGSTRFPMDIDSSANVGLIGNLTSTKANPEIKAKASSGNATDTLDAAASGFDIWRALIAGSERGRLQYRDDFDLWELIANNLTLLRAFDTGKTTIGKGGLATNATAGHLQIPSCAGTPTGTPSDIESGYVPLIVDSTNNKLYFYSNGAWRDAGP